MELNNREDPFCSFIFKDLGLPAQLFKRRFKKYMFFDADISSSKIMAGAVQDAVASCLGRDCNAYVFGSSDGRTVGGLDGSEDWPGRLSLLGKVSREVGNADGFTLIDVKGRWIAYQSRPVEIGIFGIDCDCDLRSIRGVMDSFFDLTDISNWLNGTSARDKDLVEGFGKDFLIRLIENYS